MNILVLTNEYPNEKYPKPDWTWVIPYFCRSWVKNGHRVIAINNAAAFPNCYYKAARIFRRAIATYFGVSEAGLDESAWTKTFCFEDFGVEVINFPMRKFRPGGKYNEKQLENQVERIREVLEKRFFKPDIITGHWVNPQLTLVRRMGEIFPNAHTGFVFHGDYSKEKCEKFSVQQEIKYVDSIGFRSKSAMEQAEKYLDFNKVPFVCASGIPDEYVNQSRSKKKISSKKLKILTAGRLVKYKNIPAIIDASSRVFENGEYELKIAGEGSMYEKLQNQIQKLGVQDSVRLLGKITREKLQVIMHDSDVFVLISDKETFGLVYLEAMLQGCIVIASYGGGVDGIIVDGENGFLCNQGDSYMLGSILLRIEALSCEEKSIISKKAIETAQEYTNSKVSERYLDNILGG